MVRPTPVALRARRPHGASAQRLIQGIAHTREMGGKLRWDGANAAWDGRVFGVHSRSLEGPEQGVPCKPEEQAGSWPVARESTAAKARPPTAARGEHN